MLARAALTTTGTGHNGIISHLIVFCEHTCVHVLARHHARIPFARESRLLRVALDALGATHECGAFASDVNSLMLSACLSQVRTLGLLADGCEAFQYSMHCW
jgi:hypothetical protein